MRGIVKKIALLIAVFLVIFIFISINISKFIFQKENLPLNNTSDPPLQNNSNPMSTPGETDNLSGDTAPAEIYSLCIQVYDNITGALVADATVEVGNQTGITNNTGITVLKFTELQGYPITVKAAGYENYANTVLLSHFQAGYINIYLTPKGELTSYDESGNGGTPTDDSGGTPSDNNENDSTDSSNETIETGIVSGRIYYDNKLLSPIYNASVLVDEQLAEIYGSTFLVLNVTAGEATIEAHDNQGHTIIENFTVEPSVVNSVDILFPASNEGTPPTVISTADHLQFSWENGISLELNLNGDRILGIGDVNFNGTLLRKSVSAGTFTIEKIENGTFVDITYSKCQYLSYETEGKIAIVHSELITPEGDIGVDWIFTPWEMTVEGIQYEGLGYRFSMTSPVNISKLGFRCSWELNGNISGKTLLTRREMTEWERNCTYTEGFDIHTNFLLGQSQPPDYQYAASGALASYIWPPSDASNRLQKDNDSDQLLSYDEFSFGEANQTEMPFRVILYASEWGIDDYTSLFDQISENYREFYGLEEVELLPTVITRDFLQAPPGQPYPYVDVADNILPEFAAHNFKHVNVLSVWTSNGRIGTPYDGNRLATHSIDVYPEDAMALKYFINKTHDLGMELSVWLSTCYSQDSPAIPVEEWKIVNVNGSIPDSPTQDIYLVSYRSGYLAYALERLKAVETEFGFNGIWHDSFTQGFDTDYSDTTIRPPIDQLIQFASAAQRMGYAPYLEALSSFGMPAIGSVFVTSPGSPRGDRDINAAFGGREYLAYKTSFTLWHTDDYYPMQIDYYRFLANKACPMINYAYLNDTEKDIVSQSNKDYNAVSIYMDKRQVLSNDTGVLWFDIESNIQVLFAYSEISFTLEGGRTEVFDITGNSAVEISNGSFMTQPGHTYMVQ